jgi:hypothetical protein
MSKESVAEAKTEVIPRQKPSKIIDYTPGLTFKKNGDEIELTLSLGHHSYTEKQSGPTKGWYAKFFVRAGTELLMS